ncbi:hypothetical protein AXF42_Ash021227 [Apostasia shenzhenica]|uniref:Uncharacterized protein n=1 Tax=Apostasia shenzhenica TaxID=1088818 RepID=A0A2I0A580_9ASPA|nr:hypothetical protein AXF42_Ash021227 [Apostasia shenzhenica]
MVAVKKAAIGGRSFWVTIKCGSGPSGGWLLPETGEKGMQIWEEDGGGVHGGRALGG